MSSTAKPNTDAVIYARISYDRTGAGEGVERQESDCRLLAERLGFSITRVYTDNDISATSGVDRPEFEQTLTDRPAVIITWAQDRLLRLSADLEKVITLNVPVHMVTQGSLDLATPAGRAVARTVAAWSTFETEQKGLRQLAASDQRAAKGLPTAKHGYGYRRIDGRDVIDDQEAAVIREGARRVLAGESMRSVAIDFNRRGIPSPRTAEGVRRGAERDPIRWQGVTLRQLLRRPSFAGLRTHRGQVIGDFAPEMHPAILSRDTHDRLVAMFDDPTRSAGSRIGHPAKYLLSGIARCGLCDGRMIRLPSWEPKPGQQSKPTKAAYACSMCHKVRRVQEPVDALVTEVLLRRLEREDAAELFTVGDPEIVRESRASIAAVNARLASAADMFAAGSIDAAQLSRITARGRADIEALETVLRGALPPVLPREAIGAHARAAWAGYDPERRRAILSALMRVTILPTKVGGVRKATDEPTGDEFSDWLSREWPSFNPEHVRIEWLSEAA